MSRGPRPRTCRGPCRQLGDGRADHPDPAHHVRSDGGGQPGQQLALQGAQLGGPGRRLGLQHQLAVAQLQRGAVLGDVRPRPAPASGPARWRRSAAATSPDRVTPGTPAAPTAVDRGRPGPDRTSAAAARAARRGGVRRRTSDSRTDRPTAAPRPPGPRAGLPGRCPPPANRPSHAHRPVHSCPQGWGQPVGNRARWAVPDGRDGRSSFLVSTTGAGVIHSIHNFVPNPVRSLARCLTVASC